MSAMVVQARTCYGTGEPQISQFTTGFTIGRADASQAVLLVDDEYVGALHARVLPAGGGWVIQDLGSVNGIRRAGSSRDRLYGCEPLRRGDQFIIGHSVFTFVAVP